MKGALRTAYLNMLSDNGPDYTPYLQGLRRGGGGRDDKHKKLEQKLLSLDKVPQKEMISKDPFRLVKVSDFMPVGDATSKIYYVVNKKKKPSDKDARGPYQILEVILPECLFTGEIRVDAPQREDAVTLPIKLKNIMESVGLFYGNEKNREDHDLTNIGVPVIPSPGKGSQHMIRIGRHSGAESVTIKRYRDIKIMLGKKGNTFQDHATTLWLASEFRSPKSNGSLSPFGWTELAVLTSDMETQLRDKEEAFQESRLLLMAEVKKKEAEKQREKEEKERLRIEEEKRLHEKKLAEEEEKRRLESMTVEERNLYDLKQPGIAENRVVEIYNTLDDLTQENKKELAQMLKDYWQQRGKWAKKNCSKKQWLKVQKIQGILGE